MGVATSAYVFFEWGYSTDYGNVLPSRVVTKAGPVSDNISGFDTSRVVHYRFNVRVGNVVVRGNDQMFTLSPSALNCLISGSVFDVNGTVVSSANVTVDSGAWTTASVNGTFQVQTTMGQRTVTVSKNGFRSLSQTITSQVASYTLDFKGDSGLIPDAPNVSYALACVNRWVSRSPDLGLSKILAVINAWQFPILATPATRTTAPTIAPPILLPRALPKGRQ